MTEIRCLSCEYFVVKEITEGSWRGFKRVCLKGHRAPLKEGAKCEDYKQR